MPRSDRSNLSTCLQTSERSRISPSWPLSEGRHFKPIISTTSERKKGGGALFWLMGPRQQFLSSVTEAKKCLGKKMKNNASPIWNEAGQ